MANETIASGGTLTLSTPLSGTNVQFLNSPSVGGELIVEPAAFVITSVTTGGSIVIGSVSLGGSIINDAPGDLVALQTLDSVYAALDVAFNAASENAQFNYEMKFSAESGVLYFVENDGTVKPSVNSPLTNLDANTDKILDELAGGLFGNGAAGATVTIAPFLVGTGVNTAVTDAMITVGTAIIPCFAAGTRILTVRGEIPVENLAAGDRVITIAGEEQEVVWIGRRVVDVAAHPRPETVRPIVLAPDALAEGVPARRLALSPDHALFLDGALVQAKDLVNDVTIRADPAVRWVTYFHVELARHDAIFAEGAAAESFLDTGHRAAFETGAPPPRAETMQRRRERASFAPLVTGGEALARVRERLARRLRPDLCSGALRSRM